MIRFWIIAMQLLIIPITMVGQDLNITGEAPNVVKVGERFRLVYKVDAKTDAPHIELPDAFTVLSGPGISQSTSIQIINGRQSTSFNLTFTYVLVADKEGKYTIPAAKVEKDGNTAQSRPITIEVLKADAGQQQSQSKSSQQAEKQDVRSGGSDFFVRVHISRNNIYQGEHLVATLKLYTKLSLAGFEDIKFPSFSGFFNQEIETPQQISLQRENVNGQIYQTGVIKKYVLFPQRSGKLTIDPFEVEAVVRERVRSNDPFDDFFGGRYRRYTIKDESPQTTVTVKPLPAGAPASFSGAVGNFNLETSVDKTSLKANESLTLTVKLTGEGNLKLVEMPKPEFPGDFEVYDPKIKPAIRVTPSGARGSITYEYLLIPRHEGRFELDPVSFSYFNPATRAYKSLSDQSFTIDVEEGDGSASGVVVSNYTKQDVANIGSDIRFIRSGNLGLKPMNTWFFGSSPFWLIYLLGAGLTIIVLLIRRKKIRENADQLRMRTKKASKVSKKRLRAAAKELRAGNDGAMYEAILKAIWGYLADKLAIDAASLTRDNVGDLLHEKSVPDELVEKLIRLLDDCEFARYAPAAAQTDSKTVYNNAAEIIGKLEKQIK
ncbi:hypothetical protein L21SP5_02874 [Salinivirga cyanobacteriivorans]|uniref:Protein BatD n=1 Tax=Salinivirga cyanobacteriivorans TaxID=1307839 RepID=A0A0S2I2E7_9BACT|nr:BatD family protein [Salinivirga cyanobacteriivorans]ALO16494.1 hypothetical protein L21SP5_02874 [Salinivirga cyanobacteriivorans]